MNSRSRAWVPLAVLVLLFVFSVFVSRYIYQSKRARELRITRLFVHPIKSCRGTSVSSSEYTPQGLKYDRCMQIIDKQTHNVLTARTVPKLVLVHPQIEQGGDPVYGGILRIEFPADSGLDDVKTALEPKEEVLKAWTKLDDVRIWENVTDAYICQSIEGTMDPSEALSKYIGKEVLLVFKGPSIRHMCPTPAFPDLKASTVFQDGSPILVACEESLLDVQEKVALSASGAKNWAIKGVSGEWDGELSMQRFRPNVVLEGSKQPYAEEGWEELAFHSTDGKPYGAMSLVSKCTRCLLPNVDPITGIKHTAVPYKVLTKFRLVHPEFTFKPCFGVNAVPKETGVYRVGDRVRVLRYAAAGLPDKVQREKS